jgi:hypothetical protein
VVGGNSGDALIDISEKKVLRDLLRIDVQEKKILNPKLLINSGLYSELMGLVFTPSPEVTVLGGSKPMTIPYHMVGRVRRIYSAKKHPYSKAAYPTEQANKPVDVQFEETIKHHLRELEHDRINAEVQRIVTPGVPFTKEITPFTALEADKNNLESGQLRFTNSDLMQGHGGESNALNLINVYRSAGARFRQTQGKSTSVLTHPHDPMSLTYPKRQKLKKPTNEHDLDKILSPGRAAKRTLKNNPVQCRRGDWITDGFKIYLLCCLLPDGSWLIRAKSNEGKGLTSHELRDIQHVEPKHKKLFRTL